MRGACSNDALGAFDVGQPLAALHTLGIEVHRRYPKHSPDLNAIENAWAFLRARLADTRPPQREWREAFVGRLRNAVAWVNANHGAALQRACGKKRRRALAVKANKGDMTKW